MFEKIMKWYQLGLWSKDMVNMAAGKGVISDEQAEMILLEDEK